VGSALDEEDIEDDEEEDDDSDSESILLDILNADEEDVIFEVAGNKLLKSTWKTFTTNSTFKMWLLAQPRKLVFTKHACNNLESMRSVL